MSDVGFWFAALGAGACLLTELVLGAAFVAVALRRASDDAEARRRRAGQGD